MPRYLGLDLHKAYVHGCEWLPDEQKERHFRFTNSAADWEKFASTLDATCEVAIEVTGNAFEVHDTLSLHAGRVLLANPVGLKRLGSGRHTDRVDAARLAKMTALGTLPTVWVPPHNVRAVRRLLHYRDRMARQLRRARNQARAVLRRSGVLLPTGVELRRAVAKEEILGLPSEGQMILLSALRQVEFMEQEIQVIEAELAHLASEEPGITLLLSVTGVGLLGAATIWAAIGDPARFKSPKQVSRYAGLDASVFQSGEQDYRGRISRNGNGQLRTMLVEAAQIIARHDVGALGAFYHRKAQQIGKRKAIVALARKLLVVAWRMLRTGEPYRALKTPVLRRKQTAVAKLGAARRDWNAVLRAVLLPAPKPRRRTRLAS